VPDVKENFALKARTGLNHDHAFEAVWDGFKAREITGQRVWWISISRGGEAAFAKAVEKQIGAAAPGQGRFAEAGGFRLLSAGERQFFMAGAEAYPAALDANAWFTDQTDGWIGIVVEGARSRAVLEKLVGIDLYPASFPTGSAARAPFEGMLAVIACEDAEAGRFAIHFQRSSARSFVDHLCHAAASACGPALSGGH
jgi:sarcosine oxidase subunit gamma